jgi:hypothetical protein
MNLFDFDWNKFTGLQMVSVSSFITLLSLVAIGFAGGVNWVYWVTLVANIVVSFFGALFVSYPRKDGSWSSIGEKQN